MKWNQDDLLGEESEEEEEVGEGPIPLQYRSFRPTRAPYAASAVARQPGIVARPTSSTVEDPCKKLCTTILHLWFWEPQICHRSVLELTMFWGKRSLKSAGYVLFHVWKP